MPQYRSLAGAVLASLIVWINAAAQPSSAAPRQIFAVGVENTPNFLPYSEYRNGEYHGAGRDLLDAFAARQGIQFKYVVLPLRRKNQMLREGSIDFVFPDNPNWNAQEKAGIQLSYAQMLPYTDGTLVRGGDVGKGVDRIRLLAIPLGFTPVAWLSQIGSRSVRIVEASDYDSIYQMVERNHVNAAYMNIHVAERYQAIGDMSAAIRYDPALPHEDSVFDVSSIKYDALIDAMRNYFSSDEALTIKRKWGVEPPK
jgi:hypothetical protein